jgi:hypothetical protein
MSRQKNSRGLVGPREYEWWRCALFRSLGNLPVERNCSHERDQDNGDQDNADPPLNHIPVSAVRLTGHMSICCRPQEADTNTQDQK